MLRYLNEGVGSSGVNTTTCTAAGWDIDVGNLTGCIPETCNIPKLEASIAKVSSNMRTCWKHSLKGARPSYCGFSLLQ